MCEVTVQDIAGGIVLDGDQSGWHREWVDTSCQWVERVRAVNEVLWTVYDVVDERDSHATVGVIQHCCSGDVSTICVVVDEDVLERSRVLSIESRLVDDLAIGKSLP
jgi:hypothetical protein